MKLIAEVLYKSGVEKTYSSEMTLEELQEQNVTSQDVENIVEEMRRIVQNVFNGTCSGANLTVGLSNDQHIINVEAIAHIRLAIED